MIKQTLIKGIIVLLIAFYLYTEYQNIQSKTKPDIEDIQVKIPKIPSIEINPVKDNVYLSYFNLWNLIKTSNKTLPTYNISKDKPASSCTDYTVSKKGKVFFITSSDGTKIEFYGIALKSDKKYTIAYIMDNNKRKIVVAEEGKKINKDLLLKEIKDNNIILLNENSCSNNKVIILEIFSVEGKNENQKKH